MNRQSYHGIMVFDKPTGVTSRDAVNHVQRWFPRKTRIGHAGTLDPLADGVLVICVGVATRLIEYVQRMVKVYQTRIRLGAVSDTDDADGKITELNDIRHVSQLQLADAIQEFVGEIKQTPPRFSANKIGGKRAYELARSGKEFALAAKTVHVHRIEIFDFQFPHAVLEIECGKGTYIRSIARDLGRRMGCGALVETLRRTRVGPFKAADAIGWDDGAEAVRGRLLTPAQALVEIPSVSLKGDDVSKWRQGQAVALTAAGQDDLSECAVFDERSRLIGVGQIASNVLRPVKVLNM